MKWQPIETAPKDGTIIKIQTVGGISGEPMFEGLANWRSERKDAIIDPLSGAQAWPSRAMTGWIRADAPYLVPGRIIGWMPVNP